MLVNVHRDHKKLFFTEEIVSISSDVFPKAIIGDALSTTKESGINPLCVCLGHVKLKVQASEINSPILLSALDYTLDKVAGVYSFSYSDDKLFLNPFLVSHLKSELDIDLTEAIGNDLLLEDVIQFLKEKGLPAEKGSMVIGNFHHHRYQIIKELEELSKVQFYGNGLSSLFGLTKPEVDEVQFSSTHILPADSDHKKVFEAAAYNNLVVQGPPGTGKSQVLTNLIAKFLGASQRVVVISEKHAALNVIQKKLSDFDLDKLCYIASSDRMSRSFLMELKSTWDYFENFIPRTIKNLQLSEQYEDNLQMNLDLLLQENLIGGISFHDFLKQKKNENYSGKYFSSSPLISDFLNQENLIRKAYDLNIESSLGSIRKKVIDSDGFDSFDSTIRELISTIKRLQNDFDLTNWEDITKAMKKAVLCQVYDNEIYKKYQAIFKPDSKEQKSFIRLRKKYKKHHLSSVQNASGNKNQLSIDEARSLQAQLKSSSYWTKRKARKNWAKYSILPHTEAEQALVGIIKNQEDSAAYSQILIKLYDLGIESPELEIPQIQQTLGSFTEEQWLEFENIPKETRLKITSSHRELQNLYSALLNHFRFSDEQNILHYLEDLEVRIPKILSQKSALKFLDESMYKTFKVCDTFDTFRATVFSTNFAQFKERFPQFSEFDPADIRDKVNDIISVEKSEAKIESDKLLMSTYSKFTAYHKMLITPARKLSEADKELKRRLRRGKAILVKEFGKTRSHPSRRELYSSEAREWIQLLKPIWLSNPAQLSKCFPLEEGMFDVVIFDEASQVPLQNALGGIHRSKRIIIAGDEHQMGPSSYFKKGGSEPMDLLHQSSYHYKKCSLKHHYRSTHPDLIRFSNQHFYKGELKAFPGFDSGNRQAIQHNFIKDGRFINRRNEIEADAVVKHVSNLLKSNRSLGIVAFSEEQLTCIWERLTAMQQSKITEHIEMYGGFFKALENVQGDECDQLVICFGYGQNEEGDFHMRFGPMGTSNGRQRLNVLLTRAMYSIDFFCSIRSSQFKLSDNESINLLRQWITFSENYSGAGTPTFPFELAPEIDGKKLTFSRIQETLPDSVELVTLQRTLENRGWEVCYD